MHTPQDEDRNKAATNEAPTLESFNRQLARTDVEFQMFQQMDKDPEAWLGELVGPEEVRGLCQCVSLSERVP
jgi:hypothetical protein